ncbi:hypothetical protein P7K49_040136, partial [Saguinus oedipus]
MPTASHKSVPQCEHDKALVATGCCSSSQPSGMDGGGRNGRYQSQPLAMATAGVGTGVHPTQP